MFEATTVLGQSPSQSGILLCLTTLDVIEPHRVPSRLVIPHRLVNMPDQRTIVDVSRARPRQTLFVTPGPRRPGRRIADQPVVAASEIVSPVHIVSAVEPASVREDRIIKVGARPH